MAKLLSVVGKVSVLLVLVTAVASCGDAGLSTGLAGQDDQDSGADGVPSSQPSSAQEPMTPSDAQQLVLCDGSNRIRLAASVQGGILSITFPLTNPFGRSFFAVTGDCQYWVSSDFRNGILAGQLSVDQAQELAADFGLAALDVSSLHQDQGCPDGTAVVITDGGQSASCSCGCDSDAPPELSVAVSAYHETMDTLERQALPLTGPVNLVVTDVFTDTAPSFALPWPLDSDPAVGALTQDQVYDYEFLRRFAGQLIDDPVDATALRSLRTQFYSMQPGPGDGIDVSTDAGEFFRVYVRDELPEDLASQLVSLSQ